MKAILLEKGHNRNDFNCEEETLNNYIQKQVSQDIKRNLTTCFVVVDNLKKVIGYYTLTSESLGRDIIPEGYKKSLPESYNAPVILLGRLARDLSQKGSRLGEFLLMDALFRSYNLSQKSIGAMAVVVDPLSQKAIEFYRKYDFIDLPDSKRMFLPMKLISKLF